MGAFAGYFDTAYVWEKNGYWWRLAPYNFNVYVVLYPSKYCSCSNNFSLNKVRLFRSSLTTKHSIITTADIDNPKFEVVLLPTVGAPSFLHDFLDRYLSAIAFHQLLHRHIRCVAALTFKWEMVVWYVLKLGHSHQIEEIDGGDNPPPDCLLFLCGTTYFFTVSPFTFGILNSF